MRGRPVAGCGARAGWRSGRRIEEEVMESNILMKLRENFEDKFRYDEAGVPRIWRPDG